jgi:hypothetical protein
VFLDGHLEICDDIGDGLFGIDCIRSLLVTTVSMNPWSRRKTVWSRLKIV